ncbi:hypothetical protein ONJ17_28045, partial [Salmonella enterica subsp. enterica serovar Agona]|nr:hypothetical protein [Salmonella enterica subsp. enterica serovar Agona]
PVMAVNNGVLVELDATNPGLRSEMAYESWHMQHCVGDFDNKGVLLVSSLTQSVIDGLQHPAFKPRQFFFILSGILTSGLSRT